MPEGLDEERAGGSVGLVVGAQRVRAAQTGPFEGTSKDRASSDG